MKSRKSPDCNLCRVLTKALPVWAASACLGLALTSASVAYGPANTAAPSTRLLPANWRDIKDGVGGYPAGPMLEIAVRHTFGDKLEMFKWRSEFIAMLSEQPGPLIEREWRSTEGFPSNTGAGTWTGMTWWENQQKWQDMANIVFPSPVTAEWLKTVNMTLVFAKPLDSQFDLGTLAQSGEEVLELGVMAFPSSVANGSVDSYPASLQAYLDALKQSGAVTYRFALYSNPLGLVGPYAVAYNKSGPPGSSVEKWFIYMATYTSNEARKRAQAEEPVRRTFETLERSASNAHSDIQVMTRTTSQVCIKPKTGTYSLDPDDCHVGIMGSGDILVRSYGQRPQPCLTDFGVTSMLPPKTCIAVGGVRTDTRPSAPKP